MNTQAFSIRESLKFGWEKTKQNFLPIALIIIGVTAISAIIGMAGSPRGGESSIANLVSFLFRTIVSIGCMTVALNIVRGNTFGINDFKVTFDTFWKYIVASLILGIVTAVGFVLLIVPGVYVAIRYGFATYLIVDKHYGIQDAFAKSSDLTEGKKWTLFKFAAAAVGVNILGFLALGFGLLISIPVTFIAGTWVYNELLKKSEVVVAEPATPLVVPENKIPESESADKASDADLPVS